MNNPQKDIRPDAISFQELSEEHFSLLQKWLSEPHVAEWWNERLDMEGVRAKYRPRIDGTEPTHVFVIKYRDRAVGLIQWYRWADYPKHAEQLRADFCAAGIDLAIGESDLTGCGLGSSAIRRFLEQIVFADSAIDSVVVDPEEANIRSVTAFTKVGFKAIQTVILQGENSRRCVMQLDQIALKANATRT